MDLQKYRSVFISDLHLGFRGSKTHQLLDFLHSIDCEYLYLVGDIVDIWSMKNKIYWPESHNQVVCNILDKAEQGTQVIYTPGNHDELFKTNLTAKFGNVEVVPEAVHIMADGRRFVIQHGDAFDIVVQNNKWLAKLGSFAYDHLLAFNGLLSRIRKLLGMKYWSLSGFIKRQVKNAVSYIGNYEQAVALDAKHRKVDGVICGHIHHAEIKNIDGIEYVNCGDWVESCTAVVEHYDGTLELIRWTEAKSHPVQEFDRWQQLIPAMMVIKNH